MPCQEGVEVLIAAEILAVAAVVVVVVIAFVSEGGTGDGADRGGSQQSTKELFHLPIHY